MTRFLTALFLSATLLSYGQSAGKPDKDKERINKVCDNFMQKFSDEKVSDAMRLLRQNSVMEAGTIDTLQATVEQHIRTIFPAYGKMLSYEFIREKTAKNFIAKRFYIIRFSKLFLKVDFTLYNNGRDWTITSFHYNEEAEDLLE